MAGNVWEWCSDWFHSNYYECIESNNLNNNPKGPEMSFDRNSPSGAQKVSRGGSFLCNDSYFEDKIIKWNPETMELVK
mgnify:CR=1 FL=1